MCEQIYQPDLPMTTNSAFKKQEQDDAGKLLEDGRWPSATRKSTRQSTDFSPMVSRILCEEWTRVCLKIANLASKRNQEIRQVTVPVVFGKISQSRPGFKTIELESVGLRSFLRKRAVVGKSVHIF